MMSVLFMKSITFPERLRNVARPVHDSEDLVVYLSPYAPAAFATRTYIGCKMPLTLAYSDSGTYY